LALWLLGYPKTALMQTDLAIAAARETGHVPTLLFALTLTALTHICCREHEAATAHLEECMGLAQEETPYIKYLAAGNRGCVLAQTGKASEAIQAISAAIIGLRPIGATVWGTAWLAHLSLAYAELGKLDDGLRCIGEATTAADSTKERWFEVEINRIAGELTLMSPSPDTVKAATYFQRALAIARKQKAKSWELRATMSMARLWRDQGKPQQARELLAPVYGWFTEGFDTLDLKEAKALLDELAKPH
jgi:tetratricopeptide (TPR) repeat protein